MKMQDWLEDLKYRWLRRKLAVRGGPVDPTSHYCPRFGELAVELGFVTPALVRKALAEQVNDDLAQRPHRVLGAIFFEKGWMTPGQIDLVLNELFLRRLAPGPTEGGSAKNAAKTLRPYPS